MKTILVTGYSGFIGSHLVNSLKRNYKIIGLSRKKPKNSSITHITSDIRKTRVKDIPKKVDAIIHLAALTDVMYCQSNPTKCFDINVNGTQNLLEIAKKINAKFCYVSSQHVYGNPKRLPMKENDIINPGNIYSASKAAAEILCKSYSSSFGMHVSILRLFSVYGPQSPNHLVTTRLILQLLKGNKFTVGNLSPKRDFIYINDVVIAVEIILKKSQSSNIYNIGTGRSFSILEITKILQKISNKKMAIKSIKSLSRKSDVPNVIADNSKIKKLGWKQQTKFIDGLKKTYDWYSNTIQD